MFSTLQNEIGTIFKYFVKEKALDNLFACIEV